MIQFGLKETVLAKLLPVNDKGIKNKSIWTRAHLVFWQIIS